MTKARFSPPGFDRSRLIARMKEKGVDAVLLSTPENVFYTTGYPCLPASGNPILYALRNQFPFFSFIESDGHVTLCAWIGAVLGGVEFAVDHIEMYADLKGGIETLKNFFIGRRLGGKIIGVESACPWFISRIIEEHCAPMGLSQIDDIMISLRAVKSADELKMIRKSTSIVEAAIRELVEIVRPGISRPELIQEAKIRMIKNGATGIGHVTISFGTSNPELSIEERLGKDQLVALDLGASYYGYLSDIRRHVYTGTVPERLRSLHAVMCGIVDEIGGSLIPGATAKELYERAVSLFEKNGLVPLIVNVGHGIGLMTEEAWIYSGSDMVLEPGMVINIELYTSYEEGVEIGNEETYLITENRPERITSLPVPIIGL